MNEFGEYVRECFSAFGDTVIKAMMGGYLVYFNGKLIGDVCGNELFLKRTPTSDRLLAGSMLRYPYEGSKTLMRVFDGFEDPDLIAELLKGMYAELPERTSKKQAENKKTPVSRRTPDRLAVIAETDRNERKETGKTMKTKKQGGNWTAYSDPDAGRYFAEIMYTSREGREQYDYEITKEIYDRLGTFDDDVENERLIKTAKMTYSFENTMYGTLGPERTVWDEEANEAMKAAEEKQNKDPKKKKK